MCPKEAARPPHRLGAQPLWPLLRHSLATLHQPTRLNRATIRPMRAHAGLGRYDTLQAWRTTLSFPPRYFTPLSVEPVEVNATARGVFHRALVWERPSVGPVVLRVRFVGGSAHQREVVLKHARAWSDHTNLKFVESTAYDAQIRVGFDPSLGNWSYIGRDSIHPELGYNRVSMNLADVDPGTVLHEFGHAVGLDHEHQHPDSPLQLDPQRVIADMMGPPHHWSLDEVKRNILERFARVDVATTTFNSSSIMAYRIPPSWLLTGNALPLNTRISAGDTALVRHIYGDRGS